MLSKLVVISMVAFLGIACSSSEKAAEAEKAADMAAVQQQAADQLAKAAQGNPMAAAAAAMAAMQGTTGGTAVSVVNWREIAKVMPESVEGFAADGELKGETTGMGGMQVSEVKRRYKKGDKELRLEITDTSMVAALRAPFAMMAMINEDSSEGYKKGGTIGAHPGLAEWESKNKESHAAVLVADRFLVNVKIENAEPGDAEKVVKGLELGDLAKLKAQ